MDRKWMVLPVMVLTLIGTVVLSAMTAQADIGDATVVFGVT
jgi:hypothetical protein